MPDNNAKSLSEIVDELPKDRRAEAKRKMADFARSRSEYHQQRADYWKRVAADNEKEANQLEREDA